MKYLPLCFLAAVLVVVDSAAKNNPTKNWKFCKQSDPKLGECLKTAITDIKSDIIQGNSYFGTPSIDPLHLTKLEIKSFGASSSVNIDLVLTDFDINGLSHFQLKKAGRDLEKGLVWGDIQLPKPIVVVGNYKINGKILVLPIKGEGKCNITYEDMFVRLEGRGHPIEKNGKMFFKSDNMTVDLFPKRQYIRLENLFNGNKALGENMNDVLNDNWEELHRETKPAVSQALGAAFNQIANRVYAKIPLEVLIPK